MERDTYIEGQHVRPAGNIQWGELRKLGKGKYVIVCGRCRKNAEGFTIKKKPGQEARDRKWALWRMHGWVCPPCNEEFVYGEQRTAWNPEQHKADHERHQNTKE